MPKPRARRHVIGSPAGATCGELLALLNAYIDGVIDPSLCRDLESHLAQCNPCRVVVDNVRKTITLYKQDQPCDLPAEFRNHLHAALRDCWRGAGPGARQPARARHTRKKL